MCFRDFSRKEDYLASLIPSSILLKFSIIGFSIFLTEKMILIMVIVPKYFIALNLLRLIQFRPKSFPMMGAFRVWSLVKIQ